MEIRQTLEFKKVYKKLHTNQRQIVNAEIKKVTNNPKIVSKKAAI